jgi:hypothetical protein
VPDQIADIPIFATVKIVLFVPEVKKFLAHYLAKSSPLLKMAVMKT